MVHPSSIPLSFPPDEEGAADGEEDDEECEDVGPDVGDARGGADDVVLGYEALAREGVVDDVALDGARSSIDNGAWHGERVGHGEPEDVHAACQLVVHLLAAGCLLIEEHGVGIGVEEVAEGFGGLHLEDVVVSFEHLLGHGVLQGYELLAADGWIGNGVVVVDNEVEARLEEVVVEPLRDLGLHLAQHLGGLGSTLALQQVGLAGEPIAHHILAGIVGGRQLEGVAHAGEGLLEGVLGVEPAEPFVERCLRLESGSVELQGRLLAHLLRSAEAAGEGGGDGVAFHFGMSAHEGLSVQAFGDGIGQDSPLAFHHGVALSLGHDGGVTDFAVAPTIFVYGGVHLDIIRLAARCEEYGGYEKKPAETILFHNSGFLVDDK